MVSGLSHDWLVVTWLRFCHVVNVSSHDDSSVTWSQLGLLLLLQLVPEQTTENFAAGTFGDGVCELHSSPQLHEGGDVL